MKDARRKELLSATTSCRMYPVRCDPFPLNILQEKMDPDVRTRGGAIVNILNTIKERIR